MITNFFALTFFIALYSFILGFFFTWGQETYENVMYWVTEKQEDKNENP